MLSFRTRMKRKNEDRIKLKNGEVSLESLYQPRRRSRLLSVIVVFAVIGLIAPTVWWFTLPPRYRYQSPAVLDGGQVAGNPVDGGQVVSDSIPSSVLYRQLTPWMGQYTFPDKSASFAIDRNARDVSDVTRSARGELAYVRNGFLYLHLDHHYDALPVNERPKTPYFPILELDDPGDFSLLLPAWNLDGSRLYFVMRERGVGDRVYRLERPQMNPNAENTEPTLIYAGLTLMAPPITNPATGRILLVEYVQDGLTRFTTIASDCNNPVTCSASQREVATIPASVSWAHYHPSATLIVYSDYRTGDIHLLQPSSGETQTLISDGRQKIRPTFSPDGRRLAYLADGRLYVVKVNEDLTVSPLKVSEGDLNIQSFTWWN